MNKKESIKELKKLYNESDCEIAEVICDVVNADGTKFTEQSVIVVLVSEPSASDMIAPSEHWFIFRSINDYKNMFERYLFEVENIREVKPFDTYSLLFGN